MYAIVKSGGHQYRVAEGDTIEVQKLEADDGDEIELDVLMLGGAGDGDTVVGTPFVDGATVRATVLEQVKGPKIIVQRFKPKNRYKRTRGHRQRYTRLKIDEISSS